MDLMSRVRKLNTADLADAAASPHSLRGFRRYSGNGVLCGWVRAVRAVPGDARSVHEAVMRSEPDDILVVDFGGPDVPAAGLGELVCAEAVRRGVRGIVFWGPIRDTAAIKVLDLVVYATGTEPMPGVHLVRAEQDGVTQVAGVTVRDGDLLIADEDGILVVAGESAPDAIERAERLRSLDRGIASAVLAGLPLAEHPDYRTYAAAVDERRAPDGAERQ